jgi:hypothetical protein
LVREAAAHLDSSAGPDPSTLPSKTNPVTTH